MEFFTIAVDAIQTETPRTDFTEDQIKKGAELIAAAGGLVKPLILKRGDFDPTIGDNRYTLIDGALAYWASVEYAKTHPRAGECVNAMVIEDVSAAAAQADFF